MTKSVDQLFKDLSHALQLGAILRFEELNNRQVIWIQLKSKTKMATRLRLKTHILNTYSDVRYVMVHPKNNALYIGYNI
jgi:hypothetical protein